MRTWRGVMMAAGVALALAGIAPCSWAMPSQVAQRRIWDDVGQAAKKGPVDVPLRDQALLHLPEGDVFVPQPQANRLLDMWGNPGNDPDMLGVILPRDPKASWYMAVRFEATGFVRDDDARSWNADDMLKSFRVATDEQNRERLKARMPQIEVIGWAESPRYDAAKQHLVWSIASRVADTRPDAPQLANYNTFALGRDGYFSLNMVGRLADLPVLKPSAERLLGALEFNPGRRYADYDEKTDRVASFGLAALVVGIFPEKVGIQAALPAFVVRFAIPLAVAALLVLAAAIATWTIRRRKAAAVPAAAASAAAAPGPGAAQPASPAPDPHGSA